MGNQYAAAKRREALLRRAYQAQKAVVVEQTERGVSYDLLKHEVESNRKLYDELLEKGKGANLASAVRTSTVRIVDAAEEPRTPYKPDLWRNLMAGLAGGMLLGILFVVGSDFINRSLRAPGETPLHLRVPELGVIPDYNALTAGLRHRKANTLSIVAGGNCGGAVVPAWQEKPEMLAESFRSTLASILYASDHGRSARVILVTSPGQGEGKSSTVSNLGLALAEISQRVLLIDADMRKPQLHQLFGVANTWGLSDVLKDRNSLADAPLAALVRETAIPGLFVLPSGPGTTKIANLLHSQRMAALIERFRKEFDTVLIDTPPMSVISDARMLAKLTDSVILVVRAGQTMRADAVAAKQRLTEDGISVMGTILNAWDPKSKAGYGYYYYASDPARSQPVPLDA
jgi:succinoglycan biosynthesis transport protein ExoP